MAEKIVDLRGLKCPLPALRTGKLLQAMNADEVLVVQCTDPLAVIDIPNLLRETGDRLEETAQVDGIISFRIRRTGSSRHE